MRKFNKHGALTEPDDWDKYHAERKYSQLDESVCKSTLIDKYIENKTGRVFELGCGNSIHLAKCAQLGWDVGGIDFNAGSLEILKEYVNNKGGHIENLIVGDVFSYDNVSIYNSYDLLVSFGFLEHFKQPEKILDKWAKIIKEEGTVITVIPNLFSINAFLLKNMIWSYGDSIYLIHQMMSMSFILRQGLSQ